KRLLILRIALPRRIKYPSVVTSLDFPCDLGTIGISPVQQKFPCPEPPWIQVGKISPRASAPRCLSLLVRNQNKVGVTPHACRRNHGKQQNDVRSTHQHGLGV